MNETVTWDDLSEKIEKHGLEYVFTEYYEEDDLENIEDRRLRKACLSVRSSISTLRENLNRMEESGWLDD